MIFFLEKEERGKWGKFFYTEYQLINGEVINNLHFLLHTEHFHLGDSSATQVQISKVKLIICIPSCVLLLNSLI